MTPTDIRDAVRTLTAQGHGVREISRLLKLSRNTVRRILREPEPVKAEAPCDEATLVRITRAFEHVKGNGVRVQELLAGRGDAARHLAPQGDLGRQDGHGSMRQSGLGLLPPDLCAILPPLHPL